MAGVIIDGRGTKEKAGVDKKGRVLTRADTWPVQHGLSRIDEEAFQAKSTVTLSSGTVVGLHIKNTDANKIMIVTYMRHQIIGAAGGLSFPNASNYFRAAFGRTYVSGGSAVNAINMHSGSTHSAHAEIYGNGPVLTGTEEEFDSWYTKANGDMNTFNKEGALILDPNQTLELSYVGDQTSGILYTRCSFLFDEA